ncbi:MAG TPA: hypothetical protein VJJ79_01485 [Candidatus Nanoarchaeia archaeon]|nr:hypothetical protein [Candidatus Nanoarchaeia archaeon]
MKLSQLFQKGTVVPLSQIHKWITAHVEFSLAKEELELKGALIQLDETMKNWEDRKKSVSVVRSFLKKTTGPNKFDVKSLQKYNEQLEKRLKDLRKKIGRGKDTKDILTGLERIEAARKKLEIAQNNLEKKETLHRLLRHLEKHLVGRDKEGVFEAEILKDIQRIQKCLKALGFSVQIHDDTLG